MTKFERSPKLRIDTTLAEISSTCSSRRKEALINPGPLEQPNMEPPYVGCYRYQICVLGLRALIAAGCGTTNSLNSPPNQMAKHLKLKRLENVEINYLLFLPKGYDAKAQKLWPLMLFLHGAGERGTNVWKVATHGPPKNVTSKPDFPFILVSPQCPERRIWSNDQLLLLLEEMIRTYKVDKSRVYLTGLSMGGYGTWSLGLSYPELFAAMVPICGGGEFISPYLSSRDKPEALRSLGIWALHGAKDPVVPLAESERMVELSKKLGVREAKLTVYPEAGHD